MPAQPTNGMAAPRSIKSLTIEAINLLEMAYLSSPHHAARSSALRNPPSDAMAGHHLESTMFCASPEVTDTLALASLAAHIAVDRQMPTLALNNEVLRCSIRLQSPAVAGRHRSPRPSRPLVDLERLCTADGCRRRNRPSTASGNEFDAHLPSLGARFSPSAATTEPAG